MDSLSKKIPEIKYSVDAEAIPWENAVVWTIMPRVGPRVYEWLEAEHIRYVSWTNGIVNIIPEHNSIISDKCQCIILPSGFVWVGKGVKVG
ncbi:MAG: hypothetical protein NTY45_08630 [Elusimicrobia bacterium]|nr:hypothetical protein [Elusimicrobiota bacterium]